MSIVAAVCALIGVVVGSLIGEAREERRFWRDMRALGAAGYPIADMRPPTIAEINAEERPLD